MKSADELVISLVPTEFVDIVWPKAMGYINEALGTAHGKFHISDVREHICNGESDLWIVMNNDGDVVGSFTTRIIYYPNYNAVAVDWLAGKKIVRWFGDAMDTVSEYANKLGCKKIEGYGRKEWVRFCRRWDFKEEYTAFSRSL